MWRSSPFMLVSLGNQWLQDWPILCYQINSQRQRCCRGILQEWRREQHVHIILNKNKNIFKFKDPKFDSLYPRWWLLTWPSVLDSPHSEVFDVVHGSLPSKPHGLSLTLKGQCKPHRLIIILGESCLKLLLNCTKWSF